MSAPETAVAIAARASELVGGDRDRQHGKKRHNFENIAAMWNAYLAIRRDKAAPLDGADVGHMMGVMKVARTQAGALNVDDYVDGAGYLACAGEVAIDMDKAAQAAIEGTAVEDRPFKAGDRVRVVKPLTCMRAAEGKCATVGFVGATFIELDFDEVVPNDAGWLSYLWVADVGAGQIEHVQ